MTIKYLIYGLVDPRTKLVRYIGKSEQGMTRPKGHAFPYNLKPTTHKTCWVKSLLAVGLTYEIVVLQESSPDLVYANEEWWISYGMLSGWPLTNGTLGGVGSRGRKASPELRAQMSANAKAWWASLDSAELVAYKIQCSERMLKPEYVEPNRQRGIERMSTLEAKARASKVAKRLFSTDEARAQSSARLKEIVARPENVERMAGSNNPANTRWADPTQREAARAKMKLRWQDPVYRAARSKKK